MQILQITSTHVQSPKNLSTGEISGVETHPHKKNIIISDSNVLSESEPRG